MSFWKTLIVAGLALVLGGCATKAIEAPAPLTGPSLALDAFETGLSEATVSVGDVFVYDNPVERREIIAVGDHYVDYNYGPDSYAKETWSPILPRVRWVSPLSAGVRTLTKISGSLHPLAVGNQLSFVAETIRTRPGFTTENTWSCEVQEQVSITVAAGAADTWQILCTVDGRDRVIVNYAPSIGGLVRMIYAVEGGDRIVRQLTGYASAAAAAQGNASESSGGE